MDGPDEQKGELCSACAHITFGPGRAHIKFDPATDCRLELGTLEDVIQRQNCPVCRFVTGSTPMDRVEGDIRSKISMIVWADEGKIRRTGDNSGTTRHLPVIISEPGAIGVTGADGWEIDSPFKINEARGPNTTSPNFRFIEAWLRSCYDDHGVACHPEHDESATLPKIMRFVDVQDGRIVEIHKPESTSYMALSYVWGISGNMKTTKTNRTIFEQSGSLYSPSSGVPLLIKDVMKLVSEVGQRYLWVDALCIIQDDESDRQLQISHMDAIYVKARATIITLAAHDLYSRVPGIASSREFPQYEVVKDKRLWYLDRPRLRELVEQSRWSSRAWTFQEHLLSRRRIFLAESEIILECAEGIVSEFWTTGSDRSFRHTSPGYSRMPSQKNNQLSSRLNLPEPLLSDSSSESGIEQKTFNTDKAFYLYAQHVQEYMNRSLTDPDDILYAFTGIMSAWERIQGWTFEWGLPLQALRYALCWAPLSVCSARQVTAKMRFPSWPWAHWSSKIHFIPTDCSHREFSQHGESSKCEIVSNIDDRDKTRKILRIQSPAVILTVSSRDGLLRPYYSGQLQSSLRMKIYDQHRRYCGLVWGLHDAWFEPLEEQSFDFIYLFTAERDLREGKENVSVNSIQEAVTLASARDEQRILSPDDEWYPGYDKAVLGWPEDWHTDFPRYRCPPSYRWVFALIVRHRGNDYERLGIGQVLKKTWDEALPTMKTFYVT